MAERERTSWYGLAISDVETRLNTPYDESVLVRSIYYEALRRLDESNNTPFPDYLREKYIKVGGLNSIPNQQSVAFNWGWRKGDKTRSRIPIGGNYGRQMGLLLRSKIPSGDSRINLGVWIPDAPNQGLYAVATPDADLTDPLAPEVKIAVLVHSMWVHALEAAGKRDILSEWGVRLSQDSPISRDPRIPLFDPIPNGTATPNLQLIAA